MNDLVIFLIAMILVSFISLCFFKKKFWENRFIVLLIGGGVALVVTLTINFSTRNGLETKYTPKWTKQLSLIALNDSTVDSCGVTLCKNLDFKSHIINTDDSTGVKHFSRFLFYIYDGEVNVGLSQNNELNEYLLEDVYFALSDNDSIGYISKLKQNYVSDNMWINELSLPRIQTVHCLYLPPSDYSLVPDSLIRKLPV